MKTEIECRFLEINVEKLIEKLELCGATFFGDWVQMRYCYDFKPVRKNSWIRLRTNGKETTLTIKEIGSDKIDGTKECEIAVSDFSTTDEILQKLGYKARSKQENRRIRFLLDGVKIDIDFWPQIPTYVEFEAESEAAIKQACKKLGLDYQKATTLDVESIYSKYGITLAKISELVLEKERKGVSYKLCNEKE